MLKITIFTALLIVLTASALNKEGGGSKNIRKLLDETNADKTSFATRNLERNGIESKENLVNGYQVGSYSSSSMQDRLQKEEKEGRYKFESEYSSDEQKFENSNQQSNAFEEEVKAQPILKNSVESSLLQLDEMISKVNPGLKASKRSFGETDMIDGDIKLDKDSAADLVQFYKRNPGYLRLDSNETDTPASNTFDTRKVLKDRKWRFPIKYRIQLAFSGNRELVRKAVRIWQRETCVSFRETETIKSSGINFKENKQGCWSNIGRKSSGINDINLDNGCKRLGIILHEIGHALGMWHEQSRQDRNSYVTIVEKNIESGKERNFMVRPGVTYGTQYDYGSIMHYGERALSKNGGKTIIAKQSGYSRTMGQITSLSFNDIKAINYHYCQKRCTEGLTWSSCRNGGYRDPRNCTRCKCPEGWNGTYCQGPNDPTISGCGYKYRSATSCYKYLNSPGYFFPRKYTTSSECTWKITAPVRKRVRLEFIGTFRIRCNVISTMCLDFVEVRYNSFTTTGPRFCCIKRPTRKFTSKGREMLVLFRTHSKSPERGFRARYKYV